MASPCPRGRPGRTCPTALRVTLLKRRSRLVGAARAVAFTLPRRRRKPVPRQRLWKARPSVTIRSIASMSNSASISRMSFIWPWLLTATGGAGLSSPRPTVASMWSQYPKNGSSRCPWTPCWESGHSSLTGSCASWPPHPRPRKPSPRRCGPSMTWRSARMRNWPRSIPWP